jgi:hypothetical protein
MTCVAQRMTSSGSVSVIEVPAFSLQHYISKRNLYRKRDD